MSIKPAAAHIVDTLETANAFGIHIRPSLDSTGELAARIEFDPYQGADIRGIVRGWIPFVFAINNVSRSIGKPDLYPFILSEPVIKKLGFIHRLLNGRFTIVGTSDEAFGWEVRGG